MRWGILLIMLAVGGCAAPAQQQQQPSPAGRSAIDLGLDIAAGVPAVGSRPRDQSGFATVGAALGEIGGAMLRSGK